MNSEDISMENTIEKIKIQEHDKETKLKEKRAIEATIASLQRKLRDALVTCTKTDEECKKVNARVDALACSLSAEQLHRQALAAQLGHSHKQLEHLRATMDNGISKVWELRNSLSKKVQEVSDECDVWALFMRPQHLEPVRATKKVQTENKGQISEQEVRLNNAIQKRQNLVAEKDRLMREPEIGEEFIRIKNALHYSVEMTANYGNVGNRTQN